MQPGPLPRTRDEAIRAAIALILAAAHEAAAHEAAAFAAANQLAVQEAEA